MLHPLTLQTDGTVAGGCFFSLYPPSSPPSFSSPLLPPLPHLLSDTYVTSDSGTGVVHQAPGFGEDDLRACIHYGVVTKGESVVCPVDYSGRFTDEVVDFKGQYVKVGVVFSHVRIM